MLDKCHFVVKNTGCRGALCILHLGQGWVLGTVVLWQGQDRRGDILSGKAVLVPMPVPPSCCRHQALGKCQTTTSSSGLLPKLRFSFIGSVLIHISCHVGSELNRHNLDFFLQIVRSN